MLDKSSAILKKLQNLRCKELKKRTATAELVTSEKQTQSHPRVELSKKNIFLESGAPARASYHRGFRLTCPFARKEATHLPDLAHQAPSMGRLLAGQFLAFTLHIIALILCLCLQEQNIRASKGTLTEKGKHFGTLHAI